MVLVDPRRSPGKALNRRRAWYLAAVACLPAYGQQVHPQGPVVVTATRVETRVFDAPAAIGVVDAETIAAAGPMVNLSEALSRVPGITVLNRQNFSQDLQLSVRGFGSRSTFGIRGVRLIIDGIPATMPDGQGQASSVSLGSAQRIEVLRGPLALLYGNAAGGVVQVFSEAGEEPPTLSATASAGSFDARRGAVKIATVSGPHRLTVEASRFETGGYRDHSAATRGQLNGKWSWQAGAATRLDTVVNYLDQPRALDPLGLTRAQWTENPRQAPAIAFTQQPRKAVTQMQAGSVLEHRIDADTTLNARLYLGERQLDNALSIPPAAQAPPTSSGGIVSFERRYGGAGLQLARRVGLQSGATARFVAGVELDQMREKRRGYLNVGGEPGALRRDEDNRVGNLDAMLQAVIDMGERWSMIAGVRASRVRFDTRDHYIAPGNPDDSGELSYRAANPVAGVTWHASRDLNVYANLGRGFETPTFTELAYRNDASGINTGIDASSSRHAEIGLKWRAGERHSLDAAMFDVRTADEIVVDANAGGRSTFRNAGKTTRRGAELAYQSRWGGGIGTYVALTVLQARFDEPFTSGSGAAAVPVPRGNRLPGTPQRAAFAELSYAPRSSWGGFNAALEMVHTGRIFVNDANEDSAAPATVLNLRAGFRHRLGMVEIEPLLRLDNATDRRYAGSVIVNDANRRYFEPAPGRAWLFAITVRYRFQD